MALLWRCGLFNFATKALTVSRLGSQLSVGLHTHFIDGSGRPDSQTFDTMVAANF